MKEVKAYVRPRMMKKIYNALRSAGHQCMTLTSAEGTGKYTVPHQSDRPPRLPYMHMDVVIMEIICTRDQVDENVRNIQKNGTKGYDGDGMIMVKELADIISITRRKNAEEAMIEGKLARIMI